MEEKRFSQEEALDEAEKIKDLVGDAGSRDDYVLAEGLVEANRSDSEIFENLKKGRICAEPPHMDKNWMISFMTDDESDFRLFNAAAKKVTREYDGFWQVGHGPNVNSGYTAWELWNWPKDKSPYELVGKIEEEMRRLKEVGF